MSTDKADIHDSSHKYGQPLVYWLQGLDMTLDKFVKQYLIAIIICSFCLQR